MLVDRLLTDRAANEDHPASGALRPAQDGARPGRASDRGRGAAMRPDSEDAGSPRFIRSPVRFPELESIVRCWIGEPLTVAPPASGLQPRALLPASPSLRAPVERMEARESAWQLLV